MAKTNFSTGVIVTSKFLNGAQQIYFDGADQDWHYNPLGLESIVTKGPNGLDNRYITLSSEQPTVSLTGEFIAGTPISGSKVVTGGWWFGFPKVEVSGNNINPENLRDNAPRSYTTNDKYNFANGVSPNPTIAQKFTSLELSDIVTKLVLDDQFEDLVIDNGEY